MSQQYHEATARELLPPISIIFDGPPSHESGRFVEVELDNGRSVCVGEWQERKDGLWALRIDNTSAVAAALQAAEARGAEEISAQAIKLIVEHGNIRGEHHGLLDYLRNLLQVTVTSRDNAREACTEIAKLKAERDNWEKSAAQFHRNECFYRDLLDQTATYLGPEVLISDDGSVQDSPLRLKIPDLVKAQKAERDAAYIKGLERAREIMMQYMHRATYVIYDAIAAEIAKAKEKAG